MKLLKSDTPERVALNAIRQDDNPHIHIESICICLDAAHHMNRHQCSKEKGMRMG